MYIYIIENSINGKLYVGQTTDLQKREEAHLRGYSHCPALNNAINKHGKENFYFIILERCFSPEELNEKEIYWIQQLDTLAPKGYNLKSGGECGGKLSRQTKEKISLRLRGNKHCYGKSLTDDHKQKISKANKGKTAGENNPCFGKFGVNHPRYGISHTEEHKKRMSDMMKGDNNPSYGKSGDTAFRFGKKSSEESRSKMSSALKKAWVEGKFENRKPRGGKA